MKKILAVLLLGYAPINSQPYTLALDGQFNEYVIYYISSIDLNTGSSDVQLFEYTLSCPDCPVNANNRYSPPVSVNMTFEVSMQSPAVGIVDESTLAYLYTETPFELRAPIQLDNRDFTMDALAVYDIYGTEVPMEIDVDDSRTMEMSELEDLFSAIVQTGQLPDGLYRFRLTVEAGVYDHAAGVWTSVYNVDCPDNCEKIMNVTTPVTLELTQGGPGGPWDDIVTNVVFTTYPVFNWESDLFPTNILDNCPECGFYIRVAEYRCDDHASVEDAIEDLTVLPIDQTQGWHFAGNQLNIMYPATGAVELYPGGIYAYQVQKRISTTEGIEEMNSPVYAFQVGESYNQYLEDLKDIITEDLYQALFNPCGPLTGYTATGEFRLDGEDHAESDWYLVSQIRDQVIQGTMSVSSTEVQ